MSERVGEQILPPPGDLCKDTTPPVLTCPDITRTVELGVTGTQVIWTEPIAADASGVAILVSRSSDPGTFFFVGTTDVTYTFTDGSGNTASCTFRVTVVTEDTTPPVPTCPDITRTVELGVTGTQVTWTEPTATDASGVVNIVSRSINPGTFFPVGTTDVTYTFADGSGNTANCTFRVTVITVDTAPPTILNCPQEAIAVAVSFNQDQAVVNWPVVMAIDNSNTQSVTQRTHNSGDVFQVGTTTVTITFGDSSGNTAQCVFGVVVYQVDSTAPQIIGCPADITRTLTLEQDTVQVFWTAPTASDNSGNAPTITSNFAPGDSFGLGEWRVVYTVTDEAGNSVQCTFTITLIRGVDV
ncbi:hyalin-like [Diadema antillarum]|uniref:hyalin-like n=1 Tax=Diadema antillarum TaxID=105358 RepID=UPI003A8B1CCD